MDHHSREWHESRRQGIGGSDAAAVLGVSPWKTRLELYHEKISPVPEDIPESTDYQKWGLEVEDIVAKRYAKETGRKVRRWNPQLVTTGRPWERCHLDFYVHDPVLGRGVLQIKTGMPWAIGNWVEEIPDYYAVQLQHEMMVSGCDWGDFALLSGNHTLVHGSVEDYEHLEMEIQAPFVKALRAREEEFWHENVLAGVPPELSEDRPERDAAALVALYPRDSGDSVALGADIMQLDKELRSVETTLGACEKRKEQIRNKIRVALGGASRGSYPDGSGWTWKAHTRRSVVSRAKMVELGIDRSIIKQVTHDALVRPLCRSAAPKGKGKK